MLYELRSAETFQIVRPVFSSLIIYCFIIYLVVMGVVLVL